MKICPTAPGVTQVCEHSLGHEVRPMHGQGADGAYPAWCSISPERGSLRHTSRRRQNEHPVLLAKRHNPQRRSIAVPSRTDQNKEVATSTITTLDRQLYAWLVESDERRFTLAFNVYFSVAFPAVVRYLSRISRWDSAHLEELAQDALLRFFDRVGRDRREASDTVAAALNHISPTEKMGSFHARQVNSWIEDVSAFKAAAMSFSLPRVNQAAEADWKSQIRSLADRIPVIQRQGWYLLDSTLRELGWSAGDECSKKPAHEGVHPRPFSDRILDLVNDDEKSKLVVSDGVVDQAVGEMVAKTARAAIVEEQYPGASLFVKHTLNVVNMIPRLRVPTNGYLFDIATTVYLDECKKRGRLKRGGSGDRRLAYRMPEDDCDSLPQHPVALVTLDLKVAFDVEECFEEAFPAIESDNAATSDPTLQYEHEEYFAKFYEYLHKPVSNAARAYDNAPDIRRAEIERLKLKSLAAKFARTTTVLSMLGAGNTQEQIAEHLGISRNQVKYIVEVVQEAYERFAAVSAPLRTPKRRSTDVYR
jgi:DNA-directed RNA polymerase specialized sigma24 family protein